MGSCEITANLHHRGLDSVGVRMPLTDNGSKNYF